MKNVMAKRIIRMDFDKEFSVEVEVIVGISIGKGEVVELLRK